MNKELLTKAKTAKSPEELIGIAKENGVELTEESAKAYFELLNPKTGEIADEELENVSGGGCQKNGQPVVSGLTICDFFECKKCGNKDFITNVFGNSYCNKCATLASCLKCTYCTYKSGLWLCTNEVNREA